MIRLPLVLAFVLACGVANAACGWVTYYSTESGSRTANGEHFTGQSMTAAHRSLPFGTKLKVTWKGKSVIVRVNDRGPAKWTGNDLDLAKAAAVKLGMVSAGRVKACWTQS